MPPPREVGDKRAANWNLSSKNSLKIITSLEISRSSIWVSVTKPPRWLCRNGPWPRIRSRKTPSLVLGRWRSSPGWRRRWESPTAPSPLYRNYSRSRTPALSLRARSLLRCSGSIQCSIRCGMIRASKNSPPRPRRNKFVEAAVPAAFLNFAGGTPATTGLTHSPQSSRLSANCLIMAEAALPHEARPHPREQEPAGLDRQRLHKIRSFQPAEKDRDRTKQFIVKRQPLHYRLNRSWHYVDGKHLPA